MASALDTSILLFPCAIDEITAPASCFMPSPLTFPLPSASSPSKIRLIGIQLHPRRFTWAQGGSSGSNARLRRRAAAAAVATGGGEHGGARLGWPIDPYDDLRASMEEMLVAHGLSRLGLPPGDAAASIGGKSHSLICLRNIIVKR
jgi:hypothetical protein